MAATTTEPRLTRIRRRMATITRDVVAFLAVTALLPVLVPVALVVDVARFAVRRTRFMAIRLLAFAWVFLAVELAGLLAFAATWVAAGFGANRRRMEDTAWGIQAWWSRTLLTAATRIFGLRFQVIDDDLIEPGPVLTMFRHASLVDNLLPAVLVAADHDLHLRWLLKRELTTVPALDVGAHRLPNVFVDRSGGDTATQLERIRSLAKDLGPRDGVMIFPEGTRATPRRRARAMERIAKSDPERHAILQSLRHLIPPRLGGPLALLDEAARQGVDVLFGAHVGLDGLAKLPDLWSGDIVGREVTVRFWRAPAAGIPEGRKERARWLDDWWLTLDRWVDEVSRGEDAPGAAAVT